MRSESMAHENIRLRGAAGHPSRCSLQWHTRLGLVALTCVALAVVGTSSGCTAFQNVGQSFKYNSVWNDAATKMRHRSMSSKSWHRHKNRYCNEACLSDFCAGYRQGYEDVAGGGNGCTPNFPPRDYWGWQHQSAEGQRKVAAWFSGYPHGARAAEEDGVGNWSQLQMSSNLQAQYVTAGMLPNQGHAVYPITEPARAPMGGPTPAGAPQAGMPQAFNQQQVPMGNAYVPGPQPTVPPGQMVSEPYSEYGFNASNAQ